MTRSLILVVLVATISLKASADVASSKGLPHDPPPPGCEVIESTYLFDKIRQPETLPRTHSSQLLVCKDQKSGKKHFRFQLIVVDHNKRDGAHSSLQVGDEIILPWGSESKYALASHQSGESYCSVKAEQNSPAEVGPFAIGTPELQPNGEIITKNILAAWRIDLLERTIKIIPSDRVTCVRPSVPKKQQTAKTYTGVVSTNSGSGGGICEDTSPHILLTGDSGFPLKGKDSETSNLLTSFAGGGTTVMIQGILVETTNSDTGECPHLIVFGVSKKSSN